MNLPAKGMFLAGLFAAGFVGLVLVAAALFLN